MPRIRTIPILAFAALSLSAGAAGAQQLGREGYSFPSRSPSMAAQFDFQRRMQDSATSGASASSGSMGALQQYVTQYTSNSTSIANMNQVNQTVTGGSTANLNQATDQASTGNQDAQATTKTTVDNSIVKTLSTLAPSN